MRSHEQGSGGPGWQEWFWIADQHQRLAGTVFLLCHTKDPCAAAAADLRRRLTEAACYYFWLLQQCIKNLTLG